MSKFFKNSSGILKKLNPLKAKEPIETTVVVQNVGEAVPKLRIGRRFVNYISNQRKRLVTYIKLVANDYKEVGKDSLIYMKKNPIRSTIYFSILGSFVYSYKKNPDWIHYTDTRREYLNDLIMCGSTFNKKSEYYLDSLQKLENSNLLEYKSYVFFSLILARNFTDQDVSYEKRCAHLNNSSKFNIFNMPNRLLRFSARIVDFGILNNWYFLNNHLKDFDVDENEWIDKNKVLNK